MHTKLRAKNGVPLPILAVKKNKTASKLHPTITKGTKLMSTLRNKKSQSKLINAYQKEQIEYIQQINQIRKSEEDRQSRIAWQTVKKSCQQ